MTDEKALRKEEVFSPELFPVCGCATEGMKLGISERQHAKLCKVSEEDYFQHLLDRTEELKIERSKIRYENKKITQITAKNPILIVGGGSSVTWESMEYVKDFKGKIMACEISLRYLTQIGVIPDYAATLERGIDVVHFREESVKKCASKTHCVCSSLTRGNVMAYLNLHGVSTERYLTPEEPRLSNVGLFAIYYAKEVLQADKIFLLGFEHAPHPAKYYPQHTFDEWVADFWHFVDQWPKDLIVNCCNGGVLYSDKVLDAPWPPKIF